MKKLINYLLFIFVLAGCTMEEPEMIEVEFSGVPDKGTVAFQNDTRGAQTYTWDFGDGSVLSNEAKPVHIYKRTSTYKIKLIAKGDAGSKAKSISLYVDIDEVAPPPVPVFTITNSPCTAPCQVTFTNQSLNAVSYQWDFNNGQSSTDKNPVKITYDKEGRYKVTLTATGPGGTRTASQNVTITNTPTTQPFEKVWERTYGGDRYEQVEAVVATATGGAVLVGRAETGERGSNEFKVVRIDAEGNILWEKFYGGSKNDAATAIVAVNGGFVIGGFSDSPKDVNKNGETYGDYDYWLVKVDEKGNKIWDKTYGGSGQDILKAIVPASDGGFFLGGSSFSEINSSKSAPHYGNADFWLVRVNASGDKIWDKTYGGADDDRINCMTSNNGTILLAGYSSSTKDGRGKTAEAYGGQDYWVVKVNQDGEKIGDYGFGGTRDDQMYATLFDNRYVVGGESFSPGGTPPGKDNSTAPNYGASDFYAYKFDDTGARTWERSYGGEGNDKLHAMASTPNNGLLLIGESSSGVSQSKKAANHGGVDSWMIRVDQDGKMIAEDAYGGSGSDKINCMTRLSDGSYLIAGESDSQQSDNKAAPNLGFSDFWVIRIKLK